MVEILGSHTAHVAAERGQSSLAPSTMPGLVPNGYWASYARVHGPSGPAQYNIQAIIASKRTQAHTTSPGNDQPLDKNAAIFGLDMKDVEAERTQTQEQQKVEQRHTQVRDAEKRLARVNVEREVERHRQATGSVINTTPAALLAAQQRNTGMCR